jgi:regulator of protease activity HflC (stomatin/prohibitin superfamily)
MNDNQDDNFQFGEKPTINWKDKPPRGKGPMILLAGLGAIPVLAIILLVLGWVIYTNCRIEVPAKHIAILIRKTGQDIANDQELAPDKQHKGIQKDVLSEGRYFYNPEQWNWEVVPMIEVPTNKLGVRIRLEGDNLGYGHIIAWNDKEKGIVPDVLRPGRYPINPYLEKVELHDPVIVPAGYKGVVTLLSAPMPKNPNLPVTDEPGTRGVQAETLNPGTYYLNPFVTHVSLVDCRSQRFNLAHLEDMGFPSKDGFWVSLDGIIEFRVKPEFAAQVFVIYNDSTNDDANGERIDEEIRNKIITPNARSFCRLLGSNSSGRDFIGGETRTKFQHEFQEAMRQACDPLGVEIIQALITEIKPPQRIASPVRDREVARQKLNQFRQQILQQDSEMKLAVEKELVTRSQSLVQADQEVVTMTVQAKREQEVAVTKANETQGVAKFKLQAAKDQSAAIVARGKAEAQVIMFRNEAEAAGWRESVTAFGGDGNAFARYILYRALAPGYDNIMVNTADSPMMDVFKSLQNNKATTNP